MEKEKEKSALHMHNGSYQAFFFVVFLMLLPITIGKRYWKWFQADETRQRETAMYASALPLRVTRVAPNDD